MLLEHASEAIGAAKPRKNRRTCADSGDPEKRERDGADRALSLAVIGWRAGKDSNPRPSDPKFNAPASVREIRDEVGAY